MALVASACDPSTAQQLELKDSFATLKQIIEQDIAVNQMPELFCFGLLQKFDIPLLIALSGSKTLTASGETERHHIEWREYMEGATGAGPEVKLED